MKWVVLFSCVVCLAFECRPALGQVVYCSIPYESDCEAGDNLDCSSVECGPSDDPDEILPVCPDGTEETNMEFDSEGNYKKYHLGLQVLWDPDIQGHTDWTNSTVKCSESRLCDISNNCAVQLGKFWCKSLGQAVAYTPSNELFYVGVQGTACWYIEDDEGEE